MLFVALFSASANAQSGDKKATRWEYDVELGVAIGGTSPMPLPEEIREIKSYSPEFAPNIGAYVTRWFGVERRWGFSTGLRLENKAMSTKARVKNYRTEIVGENENRLQGNWTGIVRTKVDNIYLTLPMLATYKANERLTVRGGAFLSFLLDGDFSGYVNNGYLRKDNPTGDKVLFDKNSKGVYDFSGDLRDFLFGLQCGARWMATDHVALFTDLTWGLTELFESDFSTISFSMYPIYLNIGVGYRF